jgi:hypothetical protein
MAWNANPFEPHDRRRFMSSEEDLMMLIRAAKEQQALAEKAVEQMTVLVSKYETARFAYIENFTNTVDSAIDQSTTKLAIVAEKGVLKGLANAHSGLDRNVKDLSDGVYLVKAELLKTIKIFKSAFSVSENWIFLGTLGFFIMLGMALGIVVGSNISGYLSQDQYATLNKKLDGIQEQLPKIRHHREK